VRCVLGISLRNGCGGLTMKEPARLVLDPERRPAGFALDEPRPHLAGLDPSNERLRKMLRRIRQQDLTVGMHHVNAPDPSPLLLDATPECGRRRAHTREILVAPTGLEPVPRP